MVIEVLKIIEKDKEIVVKIKNSGSCTFTQLVLDGKLGGLKSGDIVKTPDGKEAIVLGFTDRHEDVNGHLYEIWLLAKKNYIVGCLSIGCASFTLKLVKAAESQLTPNNIDTKISEFINS